MNHIFNQNPSMPEYVGRTVLDTIGLVIPSVDEAIRREMGLEADVHAVGTISSRTGAAGQICAVDEAIKAGAHVSGTLCYTTSPIHSLDMFVELGKKLEQMGCHSICIKDMAGIMSPKEAYDLVSALKQNVSLPIVVHTHGTTGLGSMTLLKAAEAGADVIDCAIACLSGGTSQPPTETMHYVLEEMGWETGLDKTVLKEINDFFKPVRAKALESGLLNPVVLATSTDALNYQIPGGMLSNLVAQLTQMKKLDKLEEVLAETPRVRADMGYPPLVTPLSQMVGVQATKNVLDGERYKNIAKEIQGYIKGEYGKAPGTIDPALVKKVLGDEQPVTCRFADTLSDGLPEARAYLGDRATCDEDVLSYIAFPQQAEAFFAKRDEKKRRTFSYSIKSL